MGRIKKIGLRLRFLCIPETLTTPLSTEGVTQSLFDWLQKVYAQEEGALDKFMMLSEHRMVLLGHGHSTRMKNMEGTPDLVQEALIILYHNILKQHFAGPEHLAAFLATIVHHTQINRHRQLFLVSKRGSGPLKQPHGPEELESTKLDFPPSPKDPAELFEKGEDLEQLALSVGILNEKEKSIITMRYRDNMSWPEIGWIIGKSAEATRKIHCRIIGLLRCSMGLKVNVDWLEKQEGDLKLVQKANWNL